MQNRSSRINLCSHLAGGKYEEEEEEATTVVHIEIYASRDSASNKG